MLGYPREDVIGHSSVELGLWVDPGERAWIIDQTDREGVVRNVEVSIRVKSGLIRTFLWSSDIIELSGTECLIVTVRDVTDQKENERQLIRSQADKRPTSPADQPVCEIQTVRKISRTVGEKPWI